MSKIVESRISWIFNRIAVNKTADSTKYLIQVRGQAGDVYEYECSTDAPYRLVKTDLFGDRVHTVADITLTRYAKGKHKDRIAASYECFVHGDLNTDRGCVLIKEERVREVLDAMVASVVGDLAQPDDNGDLPLLTAYGKKLLNSFARRKDGKLDVDAITKLEPRKYGKD